MLGERLKSIRRARNVTLRELAAGAGLSKSFISQIESGSVNPSIASLTRIVEYLGVAPSELLDEPVPVPASAVSSPHRPADVALVDVAIVRHDGRKGLVYPGSNRKTHLLTPDLQRQMMVILISMEPGEGTGDMPYSHIGEEFGWAVSGSMEVLLKDEVHILEEGDSITFDAQIPHSIRAINDAPASILMVLVPPAF